MYAKTYLLIFCIPIFLLSACSTIPKDIRKEAVDVSFENVMKNAEAYIGNTVIWGGYILETQNMQDKTRIIVLQAPLTSREEPKPRDQSKGRFMAVFNEFLDPEIYKEGREITIAGTVMEQKPTEIGDFTYRMITLRGEYIKLWSKQEDRMGYYYYRPHYDPFYDPFWPGPYYRYRHPYYW